jgi:Zn-dependent peptidase ImmA (M78 family)
VARDHTFTLNGDERWLIRWTELKGQAYGITYTQKAKHPRIVLHDGMRGKHRLTVLVHELLHAIFPQASEEVIEQAGKDIGKVLWAHGYREVPDGEINR